LFPTPLFWSCAPHFLTPYSLRTTRTSDFEFFGVVPMSTLPFPLDHHGPTRHFLSHLQPSTAPHVGLTLYACRSTHLSLYRFSPVALPAESHMLGAVAPFGLPKIVVVLSPNRFFNVRVCASAPPRKYSSPPVSFSSRQLRHVKSGPRSR